MMVAAGISVKQHFGGYESDLLDMVTLQEMFILTLILNGGQNQAGKTRFAIVV